MTKFVIFDFDDTIVNNSSLDFESFKQTCTFFKIKPPSKRYICKQRSKGLLADEIINDILKKSNQTYSHNDFKKYRKFFLSNPKSNSFLMLRRDAFSLLSFLTKNKIKCYLCSVRTNKKLIKLFLEKNNISQYFSKLLIPSDLKIQLDNNTLSNRIIIKNSLIKNFLEKISSYDNLVFVGDSEEDIISSKIFSIDFILYKKDCFNDELNYKGITVKNMKILKKILLQFL